MSTSRRATIRISPQALAFAAVNAQEQTVDYQPYILRPGISMAANLREAFAAHPQWAGGAAQVMVGSPIMLIPLEELDEQHLEALYSHTFTGHDADHIVCSVLPELNAAAAFAVNKDVRLVLGDRFDDVRYLPVAQPVVSYLHRRGAGATRNQLYVYLHDKQADVFSFNRNRFRFFNTYDCSHPRDAVYFILNVWQQLAFDQRADELYLCGDINEELREHLQRHLLHVHAIIPSAEFNRAPITQVPGLTFDLMTLFIKGR